MENPENELPVRLKDCPCCDGWGGFEDENCDECEGTGKVELDKEGHYELRHDAGESRWCYIRGK